MADKSRLLLPYAIFRFLLIILSIRSVICPTDKVEKHLHTHTHRHMRIKVMPFPPYLPQARWTRSLQLDCEYKHHCHLFSYYHNEYSYIFMRISCFLHKRIPTNPAPFPLRPLMCHMWGCLPVLATVRVCVCV